MPKLYYILRTSSFLLIGDVNARISNAQTLDKHVVAGSAFISRTRSSKDSVFNSEGKKLVELLENIGEIVVNGRINSDITSNFTFVVLWENLLLIMRFV